MSIKSLVAVVAAMVSLVGVSAVEIDFNSGWEWRRGGEKAWRAVDIPHDFMIESPWDGSANHSQRVFKPLGEAFYRKSFAYDPSWAGKRVLLDFGGIMFFGDVRVNGKKVAETEYGYLGFETDVTEQLRKDAPNVVEVWAKVGGGRSGSRWYTGGGLYRSVKLKVVNERRIARHGVYVRTKGETAEVEVELDGCRGLKDDIEIEAEILDGEKSVAKTRAPVTKGDNRARFPVSLPSMEVKGAKRWSPTSTNLYALKVALRAGGSVIDEKTIRFGFRDISFSKERGFEIDGKHVFLRGQSNHHDLGALGAAAYPDAIRRYFKTIKEFGFNSVRCSHNPYSEEFYDIADEEGIVVVDEITDKWKGCWAGRKPYLEMWPQLVTEWVKRDRNHPSVVMWSLGNELQMNETCHDATFEDWGVTTYRMMDVVVKRWDSTRPTTVAMYPSRANGIKWKDRLFNDPAHVVAPELARVTEIASFNYTWESYFDYLKRSPDMIVYQSEATTSEWLAPYFGMDRAKMVGCSYWGATEYWGEANKYPKKGWNWSFFSHTMKPYPQAWLMKSGFDRETPVVRIGVVQSDERETWNDVRSGQQALRENWNRKQGDMAHVWVFSNAAEVELFLNGRSLGKKRVPLPPPGDVPWTCAKGEKIHAVPYEVAWEPGELKAVGSNGAEHAIRTSGPAVDVKIDREAAPASASLVYFWLTAVDANGLPVPDATTEVKVSVKGPGRLLALDDGDHYTDQLFNVDTKKMKEGYLLAIVRRTGPGDIALQIKPSDSAKVHGFSVRSVTDLPEVKGRLVRMTYEKNGADLAWLDRDDDNKTFAIIFRTIPDDDTGVAHIIEHSVLCGSEKYPVKKPFVELMKSSFATFLNAMTGADITAYPVCSRNDADFLNLTDVYLDAVFHPLSVKDPRPFRQEGWHYEMKDGALTRNGVVLSEMKGAFGNPQRQARHELGRLLFPGNCYGRCSGGFPASIHNLTFEKYKEFYFRHYHPSNARIFLDGRVDISAMLARLDSCLSAYGRREVDAPIPFQEPVAAEKTIPYEIGEGDSAADKTILMDGWVYGTWRDREDELAMKILTAALIDSNEAPLKKALLGKGLCEDVNFSFVGIGAQMCTFLFAKNVKDGKADEVRRIVRETLERIVAEGIDRRRIAALVDRREFRDREQDTGGTPRGLVNVFNACDLWLYGGDPADAFRTEHLYKSLRERISQGWFENLLKRAILDNPHHARLTMTPSKTLGVERRRAEKEELAAIMANWSKEDLSRIKKEAKALEEFQTKDDSPEDLAKLPVLSLKDIPEKGPVPEWAETDVGGTRVFRVKTSANGIAYLDLYFELRGCSREELSDAAVLAEALGELPTAKRGLQELKNELDANLGRFDAGVKAFARSGDAKGAKAYLVVHVSALESRLGEIARLLPEVLSETSFDTKLTGDLVKQRRRSIEQETASRNGYHYASLRASASQSVLGAVSECFHGISFLRRLQAVDDSFSKGGDDFCRRLSSLAERVFVRRGLTAFVSDNVEPARLEAVLARFRPGTLASDVAIMPMPAMREGFRTTGKIAGTAKASFPGVCTGSGRVAAHMLSLDYLWNEIRVLGGAYGGRFGIGTSGQARYASWNDPNPARTFGVYDRSGEALRKAVQEIPSLDKYIIGTVADTEPYLTPSVEMSSAATLALSGRTPDDEQRLRREMLHTTKADLVRFADTLDSLTNSPAICVVGGTAQIDACTNLLDKVESVAR